MVSKSKELGFGVLTARVPNEIMVVLEELLIANGAGIFRIGGGVGEEEESNFNEKWWCLRKT
jgi:hypothetical protein